MPTSEISYALLVTIICAFLASKISFADTTSEITIFDGRPYIANVTVGTLLQDAQNKLIDTDYRSVSKKPQTWIFVSGGKKIELEINPNTGNTIRQIRYHSEERLSASEIARVGGKFEHMTDGDLRCREALPYSMDCTYTIDNKHGKYELTGVFQQAATHYVLSGTPKFTVIKRIQSEIPQRPNSTTNPRVQIHFPEFSPVTLHVGMNRSEVGSRFVKLCTATKPQIRSRHWTCNLRKKKTSTSFNLNFNHLNILSKISLYMTFVQDPTAGEMEYRKQKAAFISSFGKNTCANHGQQDICNWSDNTRIARLKYKQGSFLQYSYEELR